MKVAFVGISKDWKKLKEQSYTRDFLKYHLELPWYYAELGGNHVTVITLDNIDASETYYEEFQGGGHIRLVGKNDLPADTKFDVVVHWRKWFDEMHFHDAVNVINSQDHSYSSGWMTSVCDALHKNKLYGIMCFPGWHENNIRNEIESGAAAYIAEVKQLKFISGVTLGVDTKIYKPDVKDRFKMLWASDPGRGFENTLKVFLEVYRKNPKFKLHVCWPDYASGSNYQFSHPGIVYHKNLRNGPELWDLFNTSMYLPYASNFKEPSSRAHRQAMAAGCVVLYPENMGTPSQLISHKVDGYVCNPDNWPDIILNMSDSETLRVSNAARLLALNENWNVQADRFNIVFSDILGYKK